MSYREDRQTVPTNHIPDRERKTHHDVAANLARWTRLRPHRPSARVLKNPVELAFVSASRNSPPRPKRCESYQSNAASISRTASEEISSVRPDVLVIWPRGACEPLSSSRSSPCPKIHRSLAAQVRGSRLSRPHCQPHPSYESGRPLVPRVPQSEALALSAKSAFGSPWSDVTSLGASARANHPHPPPHAVATIAL
jgi:hypothetical protein